MKNKKTNIKLFIIVFIIIVGIITLILINKPKCPDNYELEENNNMCVRILERNAIVSKNAYGKEIITCPLGYTRNKSGEDIPQINVPNIEVPHLEVPELLIKCYKKVSTPPIKILSFNK